MRMRVLSQLRVCVQNVENGFPFASILCCFFLERVPTLRPHIYDEDMGPRAPQMVRWVRMMPRPRRRLGGRKSVYGCAFVIVGGLDGAGR